MSEQKTLIVAAVMPNHPSGTRRRAGFVFTVEPVVYEVTEEQRKEITADPYIRIITKGVALSDAMQAYKKKSETSSEEPKEPSESGSNNPPVDSEVTGIAQNPEITPDVPPSEPSSEPETPSEIEKPISRMNKAELIVELEKKGLVAGKDFEPEAGNKKLAALLQSL